MAISLLLGCILQAGIPDYAIAAGQGVKGALPPRIEHGIQHLLTSPDQRIRFKVQIDREQLPKSMSAFSQLGRTVLLNPADTSEDKIRNVIKGMKPSPFTGQQTLGFDHTPGIR